MLLLYMLLTIYVVGTVMMMGDIKTCTEKFSLIKMLKHSNVVEAACILNPLFHQALYIAHNIPIKGVALLHVAHIHIHI